MKGVLNLFPLHLRSLKTEEQLADLEVKVISICISYYIWLRNIASPQPDARSASYSLSRLGPYGAGVKLPEVITCNDQIIKDIPVFG